MKLYLEKTKLGQSANISFYTALEAFYNMGFEVIDVEDIHTQAIEDEHIFLGSIQFIQNALRKLNKPIPEPLDYPEELYPFLGRRVWEATVNGIANDSNNWNVFIKPNGQLKKFTGRLIQSTNDLIGCGDRSQNLPVWVSEPKEFVAEWRTFIRYGNILGVRMYKGDWRKQYNHTIIEKAVAAYTSAPAGYALDFGLTADGELLLVEANDGYSLGNYGLFYTDYAKLLSARWAQLTGQRDLCDF